MKRRETIIGELASQKRSLEEEKKQRLKEAGNLEKGNERKKEKESTKQAEKENINETQLNEH